MKPRPEADDEHLAPLLAEVAGRSEPRDPCPDANALARLAEGRLRSGERAALEAHVARCDACRSIAASVLRARARRAPTRVVPRRLFVAAAVLLLGAGAAWGTRGLWSSGSTATTEERLIATAKHLGAALPELFGDFTPLDRGERTAPSPTVRRGDVSILQPAGRVLERRPLLQWQAAGGVAIWDVAVLRADGAEVWSTTTSEVHLAWPAEQAPLAGGERYVCEVAGRGATGSVRDQRLFEVIGEADLARHRLAMQEIAARAPVDLAPLLQAHFALRAGLWLEALAVTRPYAAMHPEDATVQQTLHHVEGLIAGR